MGKRIYISVTNDLSNDQRVNRIATTLHQAGHQVTVVGRKYADSLPLQEVAYSQKRFRLIFRSGKLFYLEHAFRLFWFLIFRKVDILNANDLDTLLANFLVARIRGKELVYDSHEYFTEVPELVDRPSTQKIWLKLEKWIFPRLKKAYTVNQSIADIYANKYKVDVGVVRNLPFSKPFPEIGQKTEKLLIYQGALNVSRGIELMIEAMAHLPNYTLVICGKGDIEEELKSLAHEINVSDRVDFKGMIPFTELAEITHKAVLGFSLEVPVSENYRLALPNKLFDYIQSGVPLIAADLPEMKRVVEQYQVGKILPAENRNSVLLAKTVEEIVGNPEVWRRYYDACIKASGILIWENEKDKLLKFYS